MSLLSQLAEIPLLSPNSSRASSPASAAASDAQVEQPSGASREHYLDVAPSLRRKKTLDESGTLRTGKYKVKTISADKALRLGTHHNHEETEDHIDVDEIHELEEGDDDEDDAEQDPNTPWPVDEEQVPSRVCKSLRFASTSASPVRDDGTLASAAAADAALLATLRARSADDAARGRAVRDIRGAWEQALGVRIRAQAFVRGAGRINPSSLSTLPQEVRITQQAILAHLDKLAMDLFDVRKSLVDAQDEEVHSVHTHVVDSLKRKRASSQETSSNGAQHLDALSGFLQLHTSSRTRALGVLDAWSVGAQASAAPGGGKAAASTLRAVNTGAGAHVRAAMAGEGVERLVKRARIWRGDRKLGLEEQEQDDEADKENVEDSQTYDDSDFYATLLRELIERKGDVGSADPSLALPQRSALPKRSVDTRASKGRRIRYEVHDKLANFMPPVPRETWSDVQRDRLFRQLAGAAADARVGEAGQPGPMDQDTEPVQVELDGLRVFG